MKGLKCHPSEVKTFFLLLSFLSLPLFGEELRIATFNIRYDAKSDTGPRDWKARRDLVNETIVLMKPDILGLQEVLHGQLEDLSKAHPEYDFVGVARNDGKRRGEYAPIFYRKEQFRVDATETGTFWLSETPQKPGSISWGNSNTRICTWARLVDRKSGEGFYLFNTHWDHKSQPSRLKSALLILKRIAARTHQEEGVILTGDFNAVEESPEILALLTAEKAKLRNCFLIANPKEPLRGTFNKWNPQGGKGAMIDHIFVTPNLEVKWAKIIRHHRGAQVPSDHFPVLAVCEW